MVVFDAARWTEKDLGFNRMALMFLGERSLGLLFSSSELLS